MAVQFWQNMSILEGGVELAGHGKNVNLATTVAPLDTTPLAVADGFSTFIGGLKSATVDFEFMQDHAVAAAIDSSFWTSFGATGTVRSIATAADDGSAAYLMRGINLSYTPIRGDVGDLAMGAVSGATSTGPVVRGKLLHPSSVARTSSSTGTGRQLGAVIAGKAMYAALHVLLVSGTSPTLDVIVQSDDNAGFTTPTTRITFSQASTVSAEWGSVAGAVTDDYWRVSYTIGGSDTPTFAFAVTAGLL
jgi:hypothetical protein